MRSNPFEPQGDSLTSSPERSQEHQLVLGLKRGREASYELLLREHGGRMLAVARRLLGNEADAQDALQDALLSVFKSVGRFNGQCRLGTWLHRIAVNAALMKLRSGRRRPERPIDELLPLFDEHGARGVGDTSASSHHGALEGLVRRELRSRVRAAIDQLPESYRVVVVLRDIEELDTREVASLLDITENAVKIRLHRARLTLVGLLRERVDEAM